MLEQIEGPSKKKKSILKIGAVLAALLVVSVGVYLGVIGSNIYSAWDKIHEEREAVDKSKTKAAEEEEEAELPLDPSLEDPLTLLLLGVDAEDGELEGRSDVLMVAIVDVKNEKISLLSIPRDTYTPIAGFGYLDKINHAYAHSLETSIQTVEQLLQITIDNYVVVNFDAVVDFVDVLGGLTLEVEKEMIHPNIQRGTPIHIEEGRQHLSGEEVLYYSRFRKDSEGDFGRNRRAQQVVMEIVDQSLSLRTITNINNMIHVVGDNVRTDLSFRKITSLASKLPVFKKDQIESIPMEGYPVLINNISYVRVYEEELERVREELQRRINPSSFGDSEKYEYNYDSVFKRKN